jgi:hypothetical protein
MSYLAWQAQQLIDRQRRFKWASMSYFTQAQTLLLCSMGHLITG